MNGIAEPWTSIAGDVGIIGHGITHVDMQGVDKVEFARALQVCV